MMIGMISDDDQHDDDDDRAYNGDGHDWPGNLDKWCYANDDGDDNDDDLGWNWQETFTSGAMLPVLQPFSVLQPDIGDDESNNDSESDWKKKKHI